MPTFCYVSHFLTCPSAFTAAKTWHLRPTCIIATYSWKFSCFFTLLLFFSVAHHDRNKAPWVLRMKTQRRSGWPIPAFMTKSVHPSANFSTVHWRVWLKRWNRLPFCLLNKRWSLWLGFLWTGGGSRGNDCMSHLREEADWTVCFCLWCNVLH